MQYRLLYEFGDYILDSTGERVNLQYGELILSPEGINIGCKFFETLEEAEYFFNITKKDIQEGEYEEYLSSKTVNKTSKLLELDNYFNNKIISGYYDETEDIIVAITSDDRKSFTETLTMLSLAKDLGQNIETFTITDINNQLHELPILRLKILLLKYGIYYQTIWQSYVTYKNIINGLQTEEELNNLIINF